MTNSTRHTIFKTPWGYFGLVCRGDSICRTLLPMPRQNDARRLLATQEDGSFEKGLLPGLQQEIVAYYEGERIDFTTTPGLALEGKSPFALAVLAACRQIQFGGTETYSTLAEQIGRPGAIRAVGTALARNPIPLIIPCHRVLRTDGGLGGFSAPGGTATKQKMLLHENPV